MKKIGILGGTFNPIHNAHLSIAHAAYEQYQLDAVWFMPAGTPPHKDVCDNVSVTHRKEMVERAIAPYEMFQLCDVELKKEKPCYTYKTLKKLKERYGDEMHFYFIIGEDSFYSFDSWVKPEEICKYADMLVARRPEDKDHTKKSFQKKLKEHQKNYGNHFFEISSVYMDISSTDIRKDIAKQQDIRKSVPEDVLEYINEYHLYRPNYKSDEISNIKKQVKKALKPERYEHTIGVMHTAANLAFHYQFPHTVAMVAALLHDCAKCLSDEERLKICKKNKIAVSTIENKMPHLLHGKVGAYMAKKEYHIQEQSILHAISVHTTGCRAMSLLDKIIYVSDYIEPGRNKAPRLNEIRRIAYEDIDVCVFMILEDTMKYLSKNPDHMDETTVQTYEYYKQMLKERG